MTPHPLFIASLVVFVIYSSSLSSSSALFVEPSTNDNSTTPASTDDNSTTPASADDNSITPASTENNSPTPASTDDNSTAPASTEYNSTTPASTGDNSTTPASTIDNSTIPASTGDYSTTPASTGDNSTTPSSTPNDNSGGQPGFPFGGGSDDVSTDYPSDYSAPGFLFGGGSDDDSTGSPSYDYPSFCLSCMLANPCLNGGQCYCDENGAGACKCPPPFNDAARYDEHCQDRGDACLKDPLICNLDCYNGGECCVNRTDRSPYCSCPAPFNDSLLYDRQCWGLGEDKPCMNDNVFDATCSNHGNCTMKRADDVLGNENWHPECDCVFPWRGRFCEEFCDKTCSNGGQCYNFTQTGKLVCNCPSPWIGEYCTELPPDPAKARVIAAAVGASVAIVVVIVVASLIIYCMWRRRLVFALKLAYYWKGKEDGDGKEFDAFVSYVGNDFGFVQSKLLVKLEDELDFKLCLQDRDWALGAPNVDNIMEFLQKSRRFILVLSPSYVKCEWRLFEFQQAFQEMLQHKLKIILIKLEDIDSTLTYPRDLDVTLKVILNGVVHFNYPGHSAKRKTLKKFWERVRLSMPKKKTTPRQLPPSPERRMEAGTPTHHFANPMGKCPPAYENSVAMEQINSADAESPNQEEEEKAKNKQMRISQEPPTAYDAPSFNSTLSSTPSAKSADRSALPPKDLSALKSTDPFALKSTDRSASFKAPSYSALPSSSSSRSSQSSTTSDPPPYSSNPPSPSSDPLTPSSNPPPYSSNPPSPSDDLPTLSAVPGSGEAVDAKFVNLEMQNMAFDHDSEPGGRYFGESVNVRF